MKKQHPPTSQDPTRDQPSRRRLTLSKDTLRNLNSVDLSNVIGAGLPTPRCSRMDRC